MSPTCPNPSAQRELLKGDNALWASDFWRLQPDPPRATLISCAPTLYGAAVEVGAPSLSLALPANKHRVVQLGAER